MKAIQVLLAPAVVAVCLTGACQTTGSQTETFAPPIVEYSPEFQAKAAQELENLEEACRINDMSRQECSALATMIRDYGILRAQIRALEEDDAEQGAAPGNPDTDG